MVNPVELERSAGPNDFRAKVEALPTDARNPNAWLALYFDASIPIDEQAKAALVLDTKSWSRQFVLPLMRPFARIAIVLIQLLKTVLPRALTHSRFLHRLIYWGLKFWVSPEANFLILRHFHIGSEILAFIKTNAPPFETASQPIRPRRLEDVKDEIFLKHDLNLFNFVIDLNRGLKARGTPFVRPERLDFSAVTDGPFPIEAFPNSWHNFIDLATAIELYTPLYQLFLTDDDFWRASNSLQLDETVALYVAALLGDATHLSLVNNKHPLVPLSTLKAGHRLMLHGLAAESLHELLVQHKRAQAAGRKFRAPWAASGT
jgi:hypothetical protein